jgi:hypothetical protein
LRGVHFYVEAVPVESLEVGIHRGNFAVFFHRVRLRRARRIESRSSGSRNAREIVAVGSMHLDAQRRRFTRWKLEFTVAILWSAFTVSDCAAPAELSHS